MSITTYAEVQTAVANYLARSDLTTYIPDFIVGAETRMAYGADDPFHSEALRIRPMETSADITFTSGSGPLPTGYLAMRRLYLNGSKKVTAEETSPELFYRSFNDGSTGTPSKYIIEGENIILGKSPDVNYTGKALYYKKFDPIATATPVPWLLTNAPLAYVYGALLEASPFLRNDSRLQLWHGMFRSIINGLNRSDKRDRFSGTALAMRVDGGSP